jgi:hypothetical protein
MMLKPQDILVLLKLTVLENTHWTYSSLASELFMSSSEVHAGIRRAAQSRLYSQPDQRPIFTNLEEFLIHGIKYSFPAVSGTRTRGIVTSYGASPLKDVLFQEGDLPPVWPYKQGKKQGIALSPLYKSVPQAATQDIQLYELLTIVDALREGRVRERKIAIQELQLRLHRKGNR